MEEKKHNINSEDDIKDANGIFNASEACARSDYFAEMGEPFTPENSALINGYIWPVKYLIENEILVFPVNTLRELAESARILYEWYRQECGDCIIDIQDHMEWVFLQKSIESGYVLFRS